MTVLEDAAPCADFLPTSPAPAPAYRKPFHISKDNLDTLHNDGIVVLKDVFAPEQLQEMRKVSISASVLQKYQVIIQHIYISLSGTAGS